MNYLTLVLTILTILCLSKAFNLKQKNIQEIENIFSNDAIRRLASQENELLIKLAKYVQKTEEKLKTIRSYIDEAYSDIFENSNSVTTLNSKLGLLTDEKRFMREISYDPIKTYQLLYRYETSLKFALGNSSIISTDKKLLMPSSQDLKTARSGFLRLQLIYNMTVDELLNGDIKGVKSDASLKLVHLFDLAQSALSASLFTLAFKYLDAALIHPDLNSKSHDYKKKVKKLLEIGIRKHDQFYEEDVFKKYQIPYHFQEKLINYESSSYRNRKEVYVKEFFKNHAMSKLNDTGEMIHVFNALCQGQQLRKPEELKNLKCHSIALSHPYFRIQPLKIEILSNISSQIVYQVHDVLSDKQMTKIIKTAEPNLLRSRVNADKLKKEVHVARTSSNTWIEDYAPNSPFYFITKRIAMITGLEIFNPLSTELLQVANYGPGGQYALHYDSIAENPETNYTETEKRSFLGNRGDRIATFMIYLTDVEAGGYTVFPRLNVGVKPQKGSGIFWFNLNHDGSLNPNSLHAGCPVLYGKKFIANKWIRSDGQMFIRKCRTSKPDILQI